MRAHFFGPEASTRPQTQRAARAIPRRLPVARRRDTRRGCASTVALRRARHGLELVVHTAAQPSHDWAASEPQTDFTINANGTLNLLEATRRHSPDATFVFASTNKVYGDRPNFLPLVEHETRLELPDEHEYYDGIPTSMSIDQSLPLALRRVEGRRRSARPGVRPLLRHPDGLLSRRLPHRPEPCRRAAARLPLLPDALHGHRRALHRVRLRRQAGAGQPPQRRSRRVRSRHSMRRRGRPPSTTSAAGASATARCSRRSRCASRSPGARSTGSSRTRRGSATTAGGSATSRVHPRLPGLAPDVRHRGHPSRDLRAERGGLEPHSLSVARTIRYVHSSSGRTTPLQLPGELAAR